MGLKTGCVATVWSVEDKGKYSDVRISTSRKDKTTQVWNTDFSSYVRFVGSAHEFSKQLSPKDLIRINQFEVTNKYDKEKKVTYTSYAVFDCERFVRQDAPPTNNTEDMPF